MDDDNAIWDQLLSEISLYMEALFVLNSTRDKEVWQYVVGVAAHLEHLAVAILGIEAGRPVRFSEYARNMGLGQAAERIGQKGLLAPATVETLRAVARLRNSVVHRDAVYGVTILGDDVQRQRGLYEGGHVFSDPAALRRLVDDANAAIIAIENWLRADGRQ